MNEIANHAGAFGTRMTVLGIITIILGVLAISSPAITGLSIILCVGILMIGAGVLRMLWAFSAGAVGRGMLAFLLGGLTLLCGAALVTDPIIASGFLTIIIAVYLLVDGIAEIAAAFRPAQPGRILLLFAGLISIMLAGMIWRQFPLSGMWAIGVILGIKLILIGIIMLTGASVVRSVARAGLSTGAGTGAAAA